MDQILLPVVLVAAASLFQGTFGLGMKRIQPLSWELWWLVYALVAMILVPWAWAAMAVPELWTVVTTAPADALFRGMLFGFLWGVGGILFGISVAYVGMSLTYGIVMGLAGSVGSLVPLFQRSSAAEDPAFAYILAGVAVMLAAVALAAWAGMERDRCTAAQAISLQGIRSGKEFRLGLLIAVSSGVLSALLNVGFVNAAPVARLAVEQGALTRNASLAAWVVVLAGAFLMNAGYAGLLLARNRSWGTVHAPGAAGALRWALLTGLLWFAALGVYGQGAALMGALGPVIGWPILLGLALIVSTLWAVYAGEWRGAAAPFRKMVASIVVLIAACCLLGYANSLTRP